MNDLIESLFVDPSCTWEEGEGYDEWAGADDVRKELGMSPSQFVSMLNGRNGPRLITSDEDSYLWFFDKSNFNNLDKPDQWEQDARFFTTGMLPQLSIHRNDLQAYLTERPAAVAPRPESSTLKAQLADAQAERDSLSEALEAANTRLAVLEAASAGEETTKGKSTDKATIGRLKKQLVTWQSALSWMIPAAVAVGQDGKATRSRTELWPFVEEASGPTKGKHNTHFEAWRAALPDDLCDKNDKSSLSQIDDEPIEE